VTATLVGRAHDDVDRMAFRLSRVVRTHYPQLAPRGFTLTDLEERLLPFRDARREMADPTPRAYETGLLRLLAGERGYLITDRALQAACRRSLSMPSPAYALVRGYATTPIRLGGDDIWADAEVNTPPGVAAFRATPVPAVARPIVVGAEVSFPSVSRRATPERFELFPAPTRRASLPMATPQSQGATSTGSATSASCCLYCDAALPGRDVTFCPHCGTDLTKRQCPACSTELEAHWKFCVTCGRGNETATG
jgi:hypothetical protein